MDKTYGTVGAEQQRAMSGLAFVQGLAAGTLPLNTIARTLGYDIAEAASGHGDDQQRGIEALLSAKPGHIGHPPLARATRYEERCAVCTVDIRPCLP